MSKDFNNWTLAVSRKIYGRLLLAYPKAHREEYGAAMARQWRNYSTISAATRGTTRVVWA
jgi:hypothetical protein